MVKGERYKPLIKYQYDTFCRINKVFKLHVVQHAQNFTLCDYDTYNYSFHACR